jgi:transcriptional regulator with XRE-family HTH domain
MNNKNKYKVPRKFEAVGEALQKMRCAAGKTQREASLHLRYSSAQFISNFERGIAVPPANKLKALFTLYKVPVEEQISLGNLICNTRTDIFFAKLGFKRREKQ